LRLFSQQETAEKALSLLLNFCIDEKFANKIIELNGVQRIIDEMKEQLIEYAKIISPSNIMDKVTKEKKNGRLSHHYSST